MNIEERVKEIISEQVGIPIASILPGDHLRETYKCDSLDLVELAMALEGEFDLDINDDQFESLQTVRMIVEFVAALVGQNIAAAAPLATCGDNA
jgi:acyl carrier protein